MKNSVSKQKIFKSKRLVILFSAIIALIVVILSLNSLYQTLPLTTQIRESDLAKAEQTFVCDSASKCINVKDIAFAATGNGQQDDTAAILKARDKVAQDGGTLYFPPGTYNISGNGIVLPKRTNMTIRGAGPDQSILNVQPGARSTALIQSSGSNGFTGGENYTIEDLGFSGGTTSISLYGSHIKGITKISRTKYNRIGRSAISLSGMKDTLVEHSEFRTNGTAKGAGIQIGDTAAATQSSQIIIKDNKFLYLHDSIVVTSRDANNQSIYKINNITVSNNYFNMGWWLLKEVSANTNETSSKKDIRYTFETISSQTYSELVPQAVAPIPTNYKAHTLTDPNAHFKSLNPALKPYYNQNVRIMPLKQAGRATYQNKLIIDNNVDFVTSLVKRNDIVRAGSYFAVVARVPNKNTVEVEEWLSDQDRQSISTLPSTNSEYKVYAVILGTIQAYTDTKILFSAPKTTGGPGSSPGLYDMNGNRSLNIPAGTRYEILPERPNYNILLAGGRTEETIENINTITIDNNTILRGWSDQVGAYASNLRITNNRIEDGQDVGITVLGINNYISGNTVRHQGSMGIDLETSNSTVENNTFIFNQWVSSNPESLGNIVIRRSHDVVVQNNNCYHNPSEAPDQYYGLGYHGISIWSDDAKEQTSNNIIKYNKCDGRSADKKLTFANITHEQADINLFSLNDGNVSGNTITGNTGTVFIWPGAKSNTICSNSSKIYTIGNRGDNNLSEDACPPPSDAPHPTEPQLEPNPVPNNNQDNSSNTKGDFNNDGKINTSDLSYLLSKWNTNDSTADLNKNNIVDIFDLSALLTQWKL